MSDGISRIELKAAGAYGRYSDEAEERGLLRAGPDLSDGGGRRQGGGAAGAGGGDGGDGNGDGAPSEARRAYDEKDLLPVMIENGLEKIGVL